MCCPKIAPTVKLEASHMISNGFDQFGADLIGAEISSFFNFSQALKHPVSKVKDTSLAKRLVKGNNFAKVLNEPTIVGCPKIIMDKSSDANLTLTRRSRFKLKHGPLV